MQSSMPIDLSTPIEPRLGKKKGEVKKGAERFRPRNNAQIQQPHKGKKSKKHQLKFALDNKNIGKVMLGDKH